jgi:predicted secreted acid phosphatase
MMHYTKKWLGLALCTFLSTPSSGQPSHTIPPNLSTLKQALIAYHNSGCYFYDISSVTQHALYYLKFRINQNNRAKQPKKLAIVMDIDETALSNYDDMQRMDFGGTKADIKALEKDAHDPAIPFTKTIYQYALAHQVAVFFITGRTEALRKPTTANLKTDGYKQWAGLYMRPINDKRPSVIGFKTAMRQKIINMGYDIVLNIGDQKSDLRGGFADMSFKLPNPYYLVS